MRDSDVEREAELVYVQFLGVGPEWSVVRWVASELLRCKTVASRVFFFFVEVGRGCFWHSHFHTLSTYIGTGVWRLIHQQRQSAPMQSMYVCGNGC